MTESPPEQKTILFLASNPDGLRRVGREYDDIEEGLRRSRYREHFTLKQSFAVRPKSVQRSLLDESPQIVHFAGTGQGDAGLLLEDESGNPKKVSVAALAGLFALFAEEIRCVILNGCYSDEQARAIAQHIEYVIGMRQEVSSEAAIAFAVGFYDGLGAGRDIELAFKLACNAIQLEGVTESPEPILIQKGQLQPEPKPFETIQTSSIKLWSVPTLPPHFLSRSETLKALKESVLSNLDQPVVMTGQSQRMGIQGMGGIGKTVLATALAYDSEIQTAFPDGIYWVTVGIEPNLLSLQANLTEALSGDRLVFDDLTQGKNKLRELWQGQQSLLILDDVWNLADAEAFNVLSDRSTLLMTTRDGELVTGLGANGFSLEVLNDDQALELLAAWAEVAIAELPPAAQAIAQECGNLPLALAQCGAMVRDFTPWEDILSDLQGAQLKAIAHQFSHYPDASVFKALHKSALVLRETNPIAAERYQELAVFSADTLIPESVVTLLWQYTGGLAEKDARKILAALARKGMLRLESEYPHRLVSLHDLQQDYLTAQHSDLDAVHQQLLEAYKASCPDGWHTRLEDGYFYEHLTQHLHSARRHGELRQLLLDVRWIESKLKATDINALLSDYEHLDGDKDLQLVHSTLRLSSHVLSQDPEQLRSQLYGRLLSHEAPDIERLRNALVQEQSEPWCRSLTPSLTQAGGALLRTLSGHTSYVYGVTVSPDGQYVVSASWDNTVKVWELRTGKELRTLSGHTSYVNGVTVSPDGQYVVSASWDKTVKVWELRTGKELRTLSGHTSYVNGVTVSPDGQYVVSASWDKTVKVWELRTGKELRTLSGHTSYVNGVTVSPDGQYVVSASGDKTVKVWELRTGKELRTLSGHTDSVNGVTVSPDGQYVVSASWDNTVKVWELRTGKELRTLSGHTDSVNGVTVSPDGQYVVSASWDNTVKVWELRTGKELRTLSGHTSYVNGVTVSPDGQYVVSASGNKTVKVWELRTGKELRTLSGHTDSVNGVTVSPDGQYVVSASWDKTVKVWELRTGKELRTLSGHTDSVNGVTVSPDGQYVVSASWDKTVKVWELRTGKELRTLSGHTSYVNGVTVSPDGQYVVSASWDKTVKVWELRTGKELRTLSGHTSYVNGVTVSPDGQYVVSASGDKTVKVWELRTARVIMSFTGEGSFGCCAMTPDGRTVIAGDSGGQLYFLRLEGLDFSQ